MPEVVARDGVELYAEAHGEGVPVILSCALNTTHENWRPQVEPFAEAGYRLVLWDYRGHGRSQVPEDPAAYTIEKVVADLGAVLDWAAPGELAVVGGLSFGGLASLHFVLAHPDRVRALLLIDTGPGFKNPKAQAGWETQVERTASFLEKKGMQAFVERAAASATGLRQELPAAQRAREAIAAQDPKGLAAFGRLVTGPAPPVIDALPDISVPALVLLGEKDEAYQRAAEVMTAKLPNAERVTIPRAGHIVNIDETEAFNAAVLAFLGRVTASG